MMYDPISMAVASVLLLFATAMLAPLFRKHQQILITMSFALATVASFLGVAAGIWSVGSGITNQVIMPIGLPDLPFHLRLDALSGFFLTVIGLLSLRLGIFYRIY